MKNIGKMGEWYDEIWKEGDWKKGKWKEGPTIKGQWVWKNDPKRAEWIMKGSKMGMERNLE